MARQGRALPGDPGQGCTHGQFHRPSLPSSFRGSIHREHYHSQAPPARNRRGHLAGPRRFFLCRPGPDRRPRARQAVRPFHRQVQGKCARGAESRGPAPFARRRRHRRQPDDPGQPRPARRRPGHQAPGCPPPAPHVARCRRHLHHPEAGCCGCRGADAADRGQPERRVRPGRPPAAAHADAQRQQLQPAVGLLRRRRRHPRQPGLGRRQRQRHHRRGARHRSRQPLRPQRQHRRRLRLHQRRHRGRRRQRP